MARGITNRQLQEFQIGANRFQFGTEITNRGKRDFKSGQGLQIGAEDLCRTEIKETPVQI